MEPRHEKICLVPDANNKGADQPVHLCSLISTFVVRCLESLISLVSTFAISRLAFLCSWAGQFESYLLKNPEDRFIHGEDHIWAPSSEFVSSSIPSWQILTAHAQPFRGARDLAFCLKVPLDSLLVWASSEGSGETARMRRLAWTFAARICDKYQIRLTRSIYGLSSNLQAESKIKSLSASFRLKNPDR